LAAVIGGAARERRVPILSLDQLDLALAHHLAQQKVPPISKNRYLLWHGAVEIFLPSFKVSDLSKLRPKAPRFATFCLAASDKAKFSKPAACVERSRKECAR
jgi:hypothetical protein